MHNQIIQKKIDPDMLIKFPKEARAFKTKLDNSDLTELKKGFYDEDVHKLVESLQTKAQQRIERIAEKRAQKDQGGISSVVYALKDARDIAREKLTGKDAAVVRLEDAQKELKNSEQFQRSTARRLG